jgi:hypothetical protein
MNFVDDACHARLWGGEMDVHHAEGWLGQEEKGKRK